jgi:hypothetical protein
MSQRWKIGIIVGVIVVLGGVGLAFALSGGDDDNAASTATTTTSTTTATVVSPPSTGSTAVTIGIICTTPEDAAQSIIGAWTAGDQVAAERCASHDVISELFTTNGSGADYVFQGCFGDDPGVPDCAFTYPGGSVHFTMNGTEAEGWKAVSIGYIAD